MRRVDYLLGVLKADPLSDFQLPPKAKRVVTFLREKPKANLSLPIEFDGAQILVANGGEVFSAYVPSPRGPVFMALIEKTSAERDDTHLGNRKAVCECVMAGPDRRLPRLAGGRGARA